jgi:GntR family transcriptional regulator / MocR family aminotransferase
MHPQDAEQVAQIRLADRDVWLVRSCFTGLQPRREELELGRPTDEAPCSLALQSLTKVQYRRRRNHDPPSYGANGLLGRSKFTQSDQTKYCCRVELFLDPNEGRPRAVQIYEQLRDAIVKGQVTPGDRLMPTRTVAAELGVSRSTVTEAYGRLSAEGYIEGRAGGGSTVSTVPLAPIRPRQPADALAPTPRAASVKPYGREPTVGATFDLRPGRVDPSLFPVAAWRRCMLPALDNASGRYGDPAGTQELRAALAGWVTRSRGVTATADEVVVTAGAGHAIDLVARVLLDPGAVVAVEEPGYPPVVELLRSQGLRVVGVPVDDQGIVVEAVPSSARLVYVTPSHQYPLGVVMTRRRRLELLDWASRSGAAIVEDDYDSEFRHTARPLEPLQRLDRDGRVIYVGTFSKTLSPALRIGFVVAPTNLISSLCAIRQVIDWCPPLATQVALAALITDGHLDRHLRRSRAVYRERHRLLSDALGQLLPVGYRLLPAHAGLHIAVVRPELPAERHVWSLLERRDFLIGSLRRTYHFTDPSPGFLIGFGGLPMPLVIPACRALAKALEEIDLTSG